jgi:small-conductance mechanosensitive channel
MRRIMLPVMMAALLAVILQGPAPAQAPNLNLFQKKPAAEATAGPPAPGDVQDLIRLLSDPRVVEWLKQNATAAAPAPPRSENPAVMAREELMGFLDRTKARAVELDHAGEALPSASMVLRDAWQREMPEGETLRTITCIVIFLFIGGGIEWLYWQYFHPLMVRLEYIRPTTLWRRFAQALGRVAIGGGGIALFAVGSLGAFLAFDWAPFVREMVVSLLLAVVALRIAGALSRFILSPRIADLRLVPLDDRHARTAHRWIVLASAVTIFGATITDIFSNLAMSESGTAQVRSAALAVAVIFALLIAAALISMVWRIHRHRALPSDPGRRALYRIVPLLYTALVVAIFLLWLIGAMQLMWTVAIVALTLPVGKAVAALIDHLFDRAEEDARAEAAADTPPAGAEPSPEGGAAEPDEVGEAERRYEIYRPIARRLGRVLVLIAAVAALASAWHTGFLTLSRSNTLAGRLFGTLANIAVTLLIADLVWVWAKTAIDRRLEEYGRPEPGHMPGPEARMATLLPILRMFLMITVLVIVGLTVLSSLGVNIAPLLAGAGVVGIAIGFGAQTLVRDIVSGIFFLLDDAFRVGEYIEEGHLRGTVEGMSLRSLRVRHHRGAVHTIPFGELKSLTNYSRDWIILKLEFRVPFDVDLRLVKKLVKQVSAELLENPDYGSHFIEPLKFQGVRRMEEFNMVIGVKFMTRPSGAQWMVRRDAYQRLRDEFAKHGIDFAQRNVKVEVLSNHELTPEEQRAVAGAAQEAVERDRQQAAATAAAT